MMSLRSLLGASTGTLRQFLPQSLSRSTFFSRSFSGLSLANGLRNLRLRSEQKQKQIAGIGAVGARQIEQVRGMKTRSSVKRLCDGCKV